PSDPLENPTLLTAPPTWSTQGSWYRLAKSTSEVSEDFGSLKANNFAYRASNLVRPGFCWQTVAGPAIMSFSGKRRAPAGRRSDRVGEESLLEKDRQEPRVQLCHRLRASRDGAPVAGGTPALHVAKPCLSAFGRVLAPAAPRRA